MFWPNIFLSLRGALATEQPQSGYCKFVSPKEKYVWAQIQILHETDKAVLIDNGMKIWIPKSRIYGIRLRKNVFEIYIKESAIG